MAIAVSTKPTGFDYWYQRWRWHPNAPWHFSESVLRKPCILRNSRQLHSWENHRTSHDGFSSKPCLSTGWWYSSIGSRLCWMDYQYQWLPWSLTSKWLLLNTILIHVWVKSPFQSSSPSILHGKFTSNIIIYHWILNFSWYIHIKSP